MAQIVIVLYEDNTQVRSQQVGRMRGRPLLLTSIKKKTSLILTIFRIQLGVALRHSMTQSIQEVLTGTENMCWDVAEPERSPRTQLWH